MKKNRINLSDLPKFDANFQVSDQYFEELPSKIQEKIQKQKKLIWWKNNYLRSAVAAMLILAFGLVYFQNQNKSISNEITLSDEEISSYLLAEDVLEDDLLEAYAKIEGIESQEDLLIDELLVEELAEDLEEM